jgi:hypothetical protein
VWRPGGLQESAAVPARVAQKAASGRCASDAEWDSIATRRRNDHVKVTVLSDAANNVVVQCEGRKYPGLVLQGDRLHQWFELARREDPDSRAVLLDALEGAVAHYDRFSSYGHRGAE